MLELVDRYDDRQDLLRDKQFTDYKYADTVTKQKRKFAIEKAAKESEYAKEIMKIQLILEESHPPLDLELKNLRSSMRRRLAQEDTDPEDNGQSE